MKDGVYDPTLSDARKKASLMSVFRYPNLTTGQGLGIIIYARKQLKKKYDYFGAAGSARYSRRGALLRFTVIGYLALAAGIKNRISPEVEFFCSELVSFAYRHAGLPLGPTPTSTTPANLAHMPSLEHIGELQRK